jgi:CHASE2 domain-containing sensor protein
MTNYITLAWNNFVAYVQHDWKSNRVRFCAEVAAWACSVISAIMFAATVPHIPVVPLYSIFITGCVCSAYACYNRRSFGLLANSIFLIIIDGIGLIRYFIVT